METMQHTKLGADTSATVAGAILYSESYGGRGSEISPETKDEGSQAQDSQKETT